MVLLVRLGFGVGSVHVGGSLAWLAGSSEPSSDGLLRPGESLARLALAPVQCRKGSAQPRSGLVRCGDAPVRHDNAQSTTSDSRAWFDSSLARLDSSSVPARLQIQGCSSDPCHQ